MEVTRTERFRKKKRYKVWIITGPDVGPERKLPKTGKVSYGTGRLARTGSCLDRTGSSPRTGRSLNRKFGQNRKVWPETGVHSKLDVHPNWKFGIDHIELYRSLGCRFLKRWTSRLLLRAVRRSGEIFHLSGIVAASLAAIFVGAEFFFGEVNDVY